MRYVLAIKSPIYGSQGSFFAYQFAQGLIAKGHSISQIFFFQQGVTNGNACVSPNNDEFDLQQAWQELSQTYQIPLHLCISASQRRGIVDNNTANNPNQINLAQGFILAGLGEFTKATLEADRLITL